VYDKGRLIEGLMKDAVKNGVEVFTGVNVRSVEKTDRGVRVAGNSDIFEGTFVIGADGAGSRVAELMGFNKERTFYGLGSGLTYYVRGLNIPKPEAVICATCFEPTRLYPIFFWILPSPYDKNEYWFALPSKKDFEYVTKKSVFAKWFPDIKVTNILCYVLKLLSPVTEPYKNNVLLVGDSAWYGEAEITGSMMCGWKAAHAVTVALRDNKPDRNGVFDYIEWWKKSYAEFDDYRNFMSFMIAFSLIFSEEEVNYLYSLFKSPLKSTLNPFLVIRLIKKAMEPMLSQVQKEMPSLLNKFAPLKGYNILVNSNSHLPNIKLWGFKIGSFLA